MPRSATPARKPARGKGLGSISSTVPEGFQLSWKFFGGVLVFCGGCWEGGCALTGTVRRAPLATASFSARSVTYTELRGVGLSGIFQVFVGEDLD